MRFLELGLRIDIRELEIVSQKMTRGSLTLFCSGCACDIPSVTYQYTWEPKIWSEYYSGAAEILEYFKSVADKHNLRKYVKLQHRVDHAEWKAETGKWVVKVTNLQTGTSFEDEGDILINASGIFK
jgi:cation diffusion facilitator CzcD-associated flavoprotein CzcO